MEDTLSEPEHDFSLKLDVETAIRKLSEKEQQVITLHVNGGLRFREITDIVEEPLGTVLWRYQSAVSKLRKYLSGGVL